jgi:hypothetical protein
VNVWPRIDSIASRKSFAWLNSGEPMITRGMLPSAVPGLRSTAPGLNPSPPDDVLVVVR